MRKGSKAKMVILLAALLVFLLPACSVLSDSQIKNINAFAVTANAYTNYPSEVFKKRAELHLTNELVEASGFSDFDAIDHRLTRAEASYTNALLISDKFDLSLKLIQQYAGLLVQLSSDSYINGLDASTDLGKNLTGLVQVYNSKVPVKLPAAIGDELSKVALAVGRRLTKSKQAKELKKFIPLGNELVAITIKNLVEVLDSESFISRDSISSPSLKALLMQEKMDFTQNYKNIVFAKGGKVSYENIREYFVTMLEYDNTLLLIQKCVESANQLAKAHNSLNSSITEKKNLKEIIKETQDLINDLQDLNKIITSFTPAIKF